MLFRSGIVEDPDQRDATFEEFQTEFAENKADDVWVFSSANAIPTVLSAALGTALPTTHT